MAGTRLADEAPPAQVIALSQPALQVRGLMASYDGRPVLTGLNVDVRSGELVVLLGANGSGKSTALRCIAGLHEPDSGNAVLEGVPLQGPAGGRRVAVVFQQPHLVRRLSALDNVCCGALGRMPLRRSLSPLLFPPDVRMAGMRCLDRVGLVDRASDRVSRLSGGQQQRVAVARALCQNAPLLLADEPVSALDPRAAEQVLELLADLAHTDGLAVLAVLHQPDLARRYADRIVGLMAGRASFDKAAHRVAARTVAALYAQEASL